MINRNKLVTSKHGPTFVIKSLKSKFFRIKNVLNNFNEHKSINNVNKKCKDILRKSL